MSFAVKVENLPQCDEQQLQTLFEPFGIIIASRVTSQAGVITFEEEEDAIAAIQNMNGFEYFGKYLAVKQLE